MSNPQKESWSSHQGFILASIGAAVGLGSIWKFPYEAGSNGGSAFILCYLIGVATIVLPLLVAELVLGRRGRAGPVESLLHVACEVGASSCWRHVGWLGVATGFLILSFYAVIGGWTLIYAVDAWIPDDAVVSVGESAARFRSILDQPVLLAGAQAVFLLAIGAVVALGVEGGIEAASKLLMPLLAGIIAILALYALIAGDAVAALQFLFAFDFTKINARIAIDALGLGFFSIGVGIGVMVTYAAYAGAAIDLRRVALAIVVADTAISLLAGLMIFPLVFAHGLDPAGGPGLMFVTMPVAFARMPGGAVVAALFYALLLVSALASAISLLELVVTPLRRALGVSRLAASTIAAAACWLAGLPTVLSFNRWSEWFPLAALPIYARATFFDLIDNLTSDVLLPLGGVGIALILGRVATRDMLRSELGIGASAARFLAAWIGRAVPIAIVLLVLAPWLLAGFSR
jgi:NSS family neurotransmitter:Na+ symporter